jgi:Protein of unknown function (DUF1236)
MKKMLLTTVAAVALAGFTTVAGAQTMDNKGQGGGAKPAAAEPQKAAPAPSGGAMMQKPGAESPAHSAQGAQPAGKPEQRMGEEKQMTPQRGAEEQHNAPKGAQTEERNAPKGAQTEERNAPKGAQTEERNAPKGAQTEERNAPKGAQTEERNAPKGAQTESTTKSNVSESSGKRGSGGNVALSETQRTRIHTVIGKSSAARITNVNFNIAIGVAVPRNVHVEVLPEDVVEIVPQYEGFEYVMVGDQILIIDPDSLEIVAIIQA